MLTLSFISFLVPGLAVAGALAIASPVIIHLLSRRHRKPVTWGAMRFLIAAYRQQRRRLQLEQLLLLITRCLVVLLLGIALAGPMLSGCAGRTASAVQQPGRVIWVVMDDGLSSQVRTAPQRTRFDDQKAQLAAMIEAMSPNDRLAIWRLTDAKAGPVLEPTSNQAALKQAVDTMQPRYVAADWISVFDQLAQTLERQTDMQDHRQVIVLSGLTQNDALFTAQHQRLSERISESASLYITPPAPEAVNVQIQSIEPVRRSALLNASADAGDASGSEMTATVSATVTLRRFAGLASAQSVTLAVDLIDPKSMVVAQQRRPVNFAPGQATTAVNVDLPVSIGSDDVTASGPSVWALRGQLEADAGGDAIAADDTVWAAVELRQRLSVVIVDDPLPASSRLTPGWWVDLALSVGRSGDRSGLVVTAIRPDTLGGNAAIEMADAVVLLRPDGVGQGAWQRLAVRIDAGLVVLVAPPVDGVSTAWYGPMREQFDLPWRIQPEVEQLTTPGTLTTTARSADALALLSGDLPQLVQSVRVERLLNIEASPESVWLGVEGVSQTWPWMLHQSIGRGSAVLMGSTFDASWTNLQTKPLFVPLLHETLRSLCGGTGSVLLVETSASRQPTLDQAWRTADRLVLQVESQNPGPGDDQGRSTSGSSDRVVSVGVRPTQSGAESVEALHEPGQYRAANVAGGLVVVNVEADAGNTQASSASGFERWSQAASATVWRGEDAGLPTVVVGDRGLSLLWPLLWVAMLLILVETVLARWVSHATVARQAGLGERTWALMRRFGPWAAGSRSSGGSAGGGS